MPQVIDTADFNNENRQKIVISESGQLEVAEEWDYEPEVDERFIDPDELAAMKAKLVGVSPSQFVEFAIKVPDKKSQKHINYSFAERRYLRLPYNTPTKRVLFKCGRQVEKSTMLGNKCLSYACIISSFNVLYVSPSNMQTKTFSRDRIKEPMETSDVLKAWMSAKLSDAVFEKKLINRSQITLRYAFHNADRCRGIPADLILLDEIQDINTDNIPVIEECASHSDFKYFIYSGTPKSLDNPIEKYWSDFSTQNEWVVPCERHGVPGDPSTWHWNVLGEGNMGTNGLICDKCGEPIYAMHPKAQWAMMNPEVLKKLKEPYESFRIPQLMVPWLQWHEILDKREKSSQQVFYNEVLGLSYDSGTRPLTKQDIIDNCVPGQYMDASTLTKIYNHIGQVSPVYAGIDWGTGENSYTVMSLGCYINGFFNIFYIHRFEGQETEPPVQLDIISRLVNQWNVKLVGTDYGGGFDRNDALKRKFGHLRVAVYQYANIGQKVKWHDGMKRWEVHRTEVMSDIFNAIKRRTVFRFPDFNQFATPFASDMLNIFSEYSETLRQIQYKHAPDVTDDSFHSILLCFMASMVFHPRHDILIATDKVNAPQSLDDGR